MASIARADPSSDGVYVGASVGESVQALRPSGETRNVVLGDRFDPGTTRLASISNDNRRYQFSGTAPEPLEKVWAYLRVGGATFVAESVGKASGTPIFSFTLDADTASAVHTAFGVPKGDRSALDEGVSGAFSVSPARVGRPVPLTLTLTKASGPPVGLVTGGRDRGGRDNRFQCSATRDGVALPVKDVPDFGGAYSVQTFVAGAQVAVTTDLTQWLAFSKRGTYAVTCRWQGELQRLDEQGHPPATDRTQDLWDLDVEQTFDLIVSK